MSQKSLNGYLQSQYGYNAGVCEQVSNDFNHDLGQ